MDDSVGNNNTDLSRPDRFYRTFAGTNEHSAPSESPLKPLHQTESTAETIYLPASY